MTSNSENVVVFVASWPDDKGALPDWIQKIEDSGYVVLHPNFDWRNEVGKKTAKTLNVLDALESLPEEMLARDVFSLKCSQIQVFDADRDPGEHFLTIAYSMGIPSFAVSTKFQGIPPYFAPTIDCILKPNAICDYLGKFKKPH